ETLVSLRSFAALHLLFERGKRLFSAVSRRDELRQEYLAAFVKFADLVQRGDYVLCRYVHGREFFKEFFRRLLSESTHAADYRARHIGRVRRSEIFRLDAVRFSRVSDISFSRALFSEKEIYSFVRCLYPCKRRIYYRQIEPRLFRHS